ncbi:hypothetical protein C7E12_14820, partial [Stenotrophomonas maltophilia]
RSMVTGLARPGSACSPSRSARLPRSSSHRTSAVTSTMATNTPSTQRHVRRIARPFRTRGPIVAAGATATDSD